MTPMVWLSGFLVSVLAMSVCGLGTDRGRAYDFSTLERVLAPALNDVNILRVQREEAGTDCKGQGCERPRLTYTFKPKVPSTGCGFVHEVIEEFTDVTRAFMPAAPNGSCAFWGEVGGHGVAASGLMTERGDVLRAESDPVLAVRISAFQDPLLD